jgi:ATP-dependent helicase/nuclease subunit A
LIGLDQLLVVTFTDAAASEVRKRIRERLEKECAGAADSRRTHWQEQLAMFETAHIGTLHSFCLKLVRQHFYQLELDPQLGVLAEEEAGLLARDTLDAIFETHYAGGSARAEAVQNLIETQARGWEEPIRELVLKLHRYAQTLPDPEGWYAAQLGLFANPAPEFWRSLLVPEIKGWWRQWRPRLEEMAAGNGLAASCLRALGRLEGPCSREEAAAGLGEVIEANANLPHGTVTKQRKPLEKFLEDAGFLLTVASVEDGNDPLEQDWGWVRPHMQTLMELAREFSQEYAKSKRELGMVDFSDLEQHALELLWDRKQQGPTEIARHWQEQLAFVFVDEYQDINAAQDTILMALSRDGVRANRFLVGDVKQSIYRFRLANPSIFQAYAEKWRDGGGRVIPLVENFRSREGVLAFVNSVFDLVMKPELGGIAYDKTARLQFGAPGDRRAFSLEANPSPCAELNLRLKTNEAGEGAEDEESGSVAAFLEAAEAEKEARLVALRLAELKQQGFKVWDEAGRTFRAVEWGEMAVLLRSPSTRAEAYAKEFARLNIPLSVKRQGFYGSLEIQDLLNLLKLLDNPLQDVPAISVLRSPLTGLSPNELLEIRLAGDGPFWTVLGRWHETAKACPAQTPAGGTVSGTTSASLLAKVTTFLERFDRWRRLARQSSLSRCLDTILAETHFAEWLLTQPRGEQQYANVQRLLALTQKFDQFQRQGLFRFLRFIEAQQLAGTEPEVRGAPEENAVRLMSIHQSKGLEFPVVAVADLAKRFNQNDLKQEIILDEHYGLCPRVKPPHTGARYPSFAHWLAKRRQLGENLGEELRLLYVAMTRARDRLLLFASLTEKGYADRWLPAGAESPAPRHQPTTAADWIESWFVRNAGGEPGQKEGAVPALAWKMWRDADLADPRPAAGAITTAEDLATDTAAWENLKDRLDWTYPHQPATLQPAKSSVSVLRRNAAEADLEAQPLSFARPPNKKPPHRAKGGARSTASAVEVGNAHHHFLQLMDLSHPDATEPAGLEREASLLCETGALGKPEFELLDFKALAAFWNSPFGRQIREHAGEVWRELAFTARFSPSDLERLVGAGAAPGELGGEFIVVQGVVDLAVILPREIWLLDFKTDDLAETEVAGRAEMYAPQLRLYSHALSRIYHRPVSRADLWFLAPGKSFRVEAGGVISAGSILA